MSFARYISKKYEKQLLDTATKTGTDAPESLTKKVVHRAPEATSEFIGKKTTEKVLKPKPTINENSKNIEEIIIPPQKEHKY